MVAVLQMTYLAHTTKMNTLVEAKSVEDFDKIIQDGGVPLVVVHFWADWAPQCQQVNDVLAELAKDTQYINNKFVKIEAESVPDISQRYAIEAVPTCIFVRNQKVIDRLNGANIPELSKKVQQHGGPGAVIMPPSQPKEDLNSRLKKLTHQDPVMLFMKGNANEPRCGFSRQIIQILKDQEVKFNTFDILQDEEVRQGLKKYSDWPTYPQLYVNGELIGGLDIVKEMIESGDFKDTMPKQQSLEDRLKSLINQEPVMLFMKGHPDQPRCGFSKTTVSILKDTGVKYGHFDILSDDEVRQGLKKFSDWPTYPQLYVKGELIGGLDIIKELLESGELKETLQGQ